MLLKIKHAFSHDLIYAISAERCSNACDFTFYTSNSIHHESLLVKLYRKQYNKYCTRNKRLKQITIQIHQKKIGWQDAAILTFRDGIVEMEYDLDYASNHLGKRGSQALSLAFPVGMQPYKGALPGFVLDLVPQGDPLRRLLHRYGIQDAENYPEILAKIPLASPGNLRIKEPWIEWDKQRQNYCHKGFSLADIIKHNTEFVSYMEQHGAPIGGTSGAGGGSPKFLLRQDDNGRFHADGMLSDAKTVHAYLVKFPYTDSQNSSLLNKTEKLYYDFLRTLPLMTGQPIAIHGNILFISRFDRTKASDGSMYFIGLESFYGAHNIAAYGARLWHEDNIALIQSYSTKPSHDIIEYLKRDLVNKILANTDNHGRNTSFLKTESEICLSPLYDITAMRFFSGDFIVELTRWQEVHARLRDQIAWIAQTFGLQEQRILGEVKLLLEGVRPTEKRLLKLGVPKDFVNRASIERQNTINEMTALFS